MDRNGLRPTRIYCQVFEKLKATQAKVISFNASISACEKAEQWQLAIHLLQEALQTVQARFHDLKLVGFGLRAGNDEEFQLEKNM